MLIYTVHIRMPTIWGYGGFYLTIQSPLPYPQHTGLSSTGLVYAPQCDQIEGLWLFLAKQTALSQGTALGLILQS